MSEEHLSFDSQLLEDVAAYRAELEAKPEDELDILIEVEESRLRQEQRPRPFFERPSSDADFAVWIGMPTLTSDQTAALLLGKEPSIVARVLEDFPESAFAKRYCQLKALLESSQAANQLNLPGRPIDIVNWARDRGIAIPPALNTAFPKLVASDDVGDTPSGKVAACMEAMQALWGAKPKGVNQKDQLTAINRWLTQKNRSTVSLSTVKRAFARKIRLPEPIREVVEPEQVIVIGPTADSDD